MDGHETRSHLAEMGATDACRRIIIQIIVTYRTGGRKITEFFTNDSRQQNVPNKFPSNSSFDYRYLHDNMSLVECLKTELTTGPAHVVAINVLLLPSDPMKHPEQ